MDRPLRVFDLFSGLNSRGDPFREAGHEVFAIDIDQRFDADAYLDIGDVAAVLETVPWRPDLIFASPPCRSFSMMQASAWRHDNEPGVPSLSWSRITGIMLLSHRGGSHGKARVSTRVPPAGARSARSGPPAH
jgi:site-specific DNA-cytosine methylase